MLLRLQEIRKELLKEDFNILLDMIVDDVKFGISLGCNYTEEKLLGVINSAYEVLKRTCPTDQSKGIVRLENIQD